MVGGPLNTPPIEEEPALLRRHLSSLSEAIAQTRQEIADLRQQQVSGRACDELHAVVQGTEQATDTILTASEHVDALARQIAARAHDSATQADAHAIQAQMQSIFGACNFQDLTGQRISKVVRTIVLVEQRVGMMLRLCSRAEDAPAPCKPAAFKNTEEGLLNGPALPGDVTVSQDTVDALFP